MSKEPSTEPTTESSVIAQPPRKRRKTSTSESQSESSPNQCDVSQTEDSALPGESEQSDQQTDSAFVSVPAAIPPLPSTPVPPPPPPVLSAETADPRLAPPPQASSVKPSIKIEPSFELQVKSPGLIKSPKSDMPVALIKTEPIPVGVVLPMPAVGKQFTSPPVVIPKPEKIVVKAERSEKERSREKENVKQENEIELVDVERDSVSPGDTTPGPDPKPDHAEAMVLKNANAK